MVTENKEVRLKGFEIQKDSRIGFLCKEVNEVNDDISILLYEEGDTFTSESEAISFLRSKYGKIENEGAILQMDRCKLAQVRFLTSEEGSPRGCVLYKDSLGCVGILRYELQRFHDEISAKEFLKEMHHPSQIHFDNEWHT
jgi:hypothetical protein